MPTFTRHYHDNDESPPIITCSSTTKHEMEEEIEATSEDQMDNETKSDGGDAKGEEWAEPTKEELDEKQKKGLGGLSPEKKRLLKKLIMDRAMEELRKEEEEKKLVKQKFMEDHVEALRSGDMGEDEFRKYCEFLHDKICDMEEEKYDWEVKLRKQDYEINQLTIQVNDIRGKFVKPVLRKVSGAESKLAKLNELKESLAKLSRKSESEISEGDLHNDAGGGGTEDNEVQNGEESE